MAELFAKLVRSLPRSMVDRFAIFAVGLLGLASLGSLMQFWGLHPDSADRILIVAGSLYVVWYHWPELLAARIHPLTIAAIPLLLLALVLIPAGWLLWARATVGRTAVLWFQWYGWLALVCGYVLARYGWPRLRVLAFPIVFVLFALPIPSTLLAPLQMQLQEGMTTLAHFVLPKIGFPVIFRDGYILSLQGGPLGVEEACSGVRSLTALTALAAFIAYWRGFGPIRGIALVVLSIPIVLTVNATRVILSGVIQETAGRKYIQGDYHEALGFAMVFLGLGMILMISGWLAPKAEPIPPESQPPVDVPASSLIAKLMIHGSLGLIVALTLAGISLGWNAERNLSVQAPLEQIPQQIGEWKSRDIEIPKVTLDALAPDRAICRMYENNLGQEIVVYVIFWATADLVKGYHHPDICMGCLGYKPAARRREIICPSDGGAIDLTLRELVRSDAGIELDRQFIVYWTQEGSRVWNDDDELRAQSGGFFLNPKHWIGEFTNSENKSSSGRIQVIIGTKSTNVTGQKEAISFARQLADEIYKLCPWASKPFSK